MKYYRLNYCSNDLIMYIEIYTAIKNCFDIYQTSEHPEVPADIMFSYIMKESRGRWNHMVIQEILKEFEIKKS